MSKNVIFSPDQEPKKIIIPEKSNLSITIDHNPESPYYVYLEIFVKDQAQVTMHLNITHGADITIISYLEGSHAQFNLFGTILLCNSTTLNLNTHQIHSGQDTVSAIQFKGVLYNHSSINYEGLIQIKKDASHSQASYVNKNLLLGPDAKTSSKPSMEILHNQVQCSHGTATSHINRDQITYLASRGIEIDQAKKIIVNGFIEYE